MAYTSGLKKQIESEIQQYLTRTVTVGDDYDYSQNKLVRRISLFENHIYPTGKFDSQGNYKFWYDIINPRIDAEVKNIDYDAKNIRAMSDRKVDELAVIIANMRLKKFLRDNGFSEEINSSLEEGAGWGNVVWKRVKRKWERVNLKNFYVINQTAENLDQSPVIERHQFSQTDLRTMDGAWDYIDEVIEGCKENTYKSDAESSEFETTTPYYEIYERNGEVCLADLKREKGEPVAPKDENTYVLAKVIAAGKSTQGGGIEIKYILFSEDLGNKKISDIYKEYHRGRYKGRWFREGLYELLFDVQVRANQIGNQIAKGLEWASKTVFISPDPLFIQNIITDLNNGDVLKAKDLRQVEVRMQGFDQLANDWNRNIQLANDIANSQEVILGITPPSGVPLGTTQLVNQNAGKFYDFIREKFSIPMSEMFNQWVLPDLVDDLKTKDIMTLTGDTEMLNRVREMVANSWYINNLPFLPPHSNDEKEIFIQEKIEELKKRPNLIMKDMRKLWDGFKQAVYVDITGENSTITEDTTALTSAIGLMSDPVRRDAALDMVLKQKGIDIAALPKSKPMEESAMVGAERMITKNEKTS